MTNYMLLKESFRLDHLANVKARQVELNYVRYVGASTSKNYFALIKLISTSDTKQGILRNKRVIHSLLKILS